MATWTEVGFPEVARSTRFDAEYYHPRFLKYESETAKFGGPLWSYIKEIIQPTEFIREYVDSAHDAAALFWRAQNVRRGYVDTDNAEHIDSVTFRSLSNSHVKEGDILITRTGANAGDCAAVPAGTENVAVSSHTLRLIPKSVDLGYAIATFFASNLGREILFRTISGSSRPQITKEMLGTIRVPDFSSTAGDISKRIRAFYAQRETARALFLNAEDLLLTELSLKDISPFSQLAYEYKFRDVAYAGRFDSYYYQPKYVQLLNRLRSQAHTTLGAISTFAGGATPLGAVYPQRGVPFLRIQNIGKNHLILEDVAFVNEETHNKLLQRSQLQPLDVLITITGRIGTTAVIPEDMHEGNINQHIVRVRITDKDFDPYYTSVFLNSLAGILQTERESYGTTREALPYYCLQNIVIPRSSRGLQNQIRSSVLKANAARLVADELMEEAKRFAEEVILNGASSHVA